jgi:hypothetical protein
MKTKEVIVRDNIKKIQSKTGKKTSQYSFTRRWRIEILFPQACHFAVCLVWRPKGFVEEAPIYGECFTLYGNSENSFLFKSGVWWYYSGVWGQLQVSDQDDSLEGSKGLLLLGV